MFWLPVVYSSEHRPNPIPLPESFKLPLAPSAFCFKKAKISLGSINRFFYYYFMVFIKANVLLRHGTDSV